MVKASPIGNMTSRLKTRSWIELNLQECLWRKTCFSFDISPLHRDFSTITLESLRLSDIGVETQPTAIRGNSILLLESCKQPLEGKLDNNWRLDYCSSSFLLAWVPSNTLVWSPENIQIGQRLTFRPSRQLSWLIQIHKHPRYSWWITNNSQTTIVDLIEKLWNVLLLWL